MGEGAYLRRILLLTIGAVWLAGVSWGQQFPDDPVEELRGLLKTAVRDPHERDQGLKKQVAALEGDRDLRRALELVEWNYVDLEEELAEVTRANRFDLAKRFEEAIRKDLHQGNTERQLSALKMLAEMSGGHASALVEVGLGRRLSPDLVELIEQGWPKVGEKTAEVLGQVDPDPAVALPALKEALSAKQEPSLRQAAGRGLVCLLQRVAGRAGRNTGPEEMETVRNTLVETARAAVPVAARALGDSNSEVRRLGMEALGEATDTLYSLVRNPRFHGVKVDEPNDRELLETEWKALLPLMEGLKKQGPKLGQAFLDPDRKIRLLAGQALENLAASRRELGQRAQRVGVTLASLGKRIDDTAAGGEEIQPAAFPPPPAEGGTDPLLEGLRPTLSALMAEIFDPDVGARRRALDVLETLGPEAAPAAPALVRALTDPDRFMRWAAARTLGKIGPVEPATAVPALARLLGDTDLDVCLAAANTLRGYGPSGKGAVPGLMRALDDREVELRLAALRTLRSLGLEARPAIPALKDALADSDARVRRMADEVLSKLESTSQKPMK